MKSTIISWIGSKDLRGEPEAKIAALHRHQLEMIRASSWDYGTFRPPQTHSLRSFHTESERASDAAMRLTEKCIEQQIGMCAQADAQADLSLRWAHMPFCWFCHEAALLLKASFILFFLNINLKC